MVLGKLFKFVRILYVILAAFSRLGYATSDLPNRSNILPLKTESDIEQLLRPTGKHIEERKRLEFNIKATRLKLSEVKVVLVNYALIRRDFPELSGKSDYLIDSFLLQNAYMANTQIEQGERAGVNQSIGLPKDRIIVDAFRPKDYGRAIVAPAMLGKTRIGWLDIKGAGAHKPISDKAFHGNGLYSVADGLYEYFSENLISLVFWHHNRLEHLEANHALKTVGVYAVLDIGFKITDPRMETGKRAGLLMRQAHVRNENLHSIASPEVAVPIEKVLFTYGLSGRFSPRTNSPELTFLDIQTSKEGGVVDFMTFHMWTNYDGKENPKYNLEYARKHKAQVTLKDKFKMQSLDNDKRTKSEKKGESRMGPVVIRYGELTRRPEFEIDLDTSKVIKSFDGYDQNFERMKATGEIDQLKTHTSKVINDLLAKIFNKLPKDGV